jgi:gluconolactonase
VKPIFNSYFGLPFSGLNDITIAPNSDNNFPAYSYPIGLSPPQLSTGAYYYDALSSQLLPAISQSSILGLNALKLTPDLKSLIVGATSDTSSEIYKFDLDDSLRPTNQRLFVVPRFFLDGLQIDDKGRVWSVEGDGIVARSEDGRILGVVNRSFFGRQEKGALQWANLGLCGDVLVVLAVDRIWTVKLVESVVTVDSRHVFG